MSGDARSDESADVSAAIDESADVSAAISRMATQADIRRGRRGSRAGLA